MIQRVSFAQHYIISCHWFCTTGEKSFKRCSGGDPPSRFKATQDFRHIYTASEPVDVSVLDIFLY